MSTGRLRKCSPYMHALRFSGLDTYTENVQLDLCQRKNTSPRPQNRGRISRGKAANWSIRCRECVATPGYIWTNPHQNILAPPTRRLYSYLGKICMYDTYAARVHHNVLALVSIEQDPVRCCGGSCM